MTRLVAGLAALLVLAPATPTAAYIVEVTTSVALEAAADEDRLREALQVAVDGVLAESIAFQPTLVVLTDAAVVGDRLFIRLLVADHEGERTFRELHDPPAEGAEPPPPAELWI